MFVVCRVFLFYFVVVCLGRSLRSGGDRGDRGDSETQAGIPAAMRELMKQSFSPLPGCIAVPVLVPRFG